ncbi:MAG: hypothetical protein ACT4P7_06405 [Gemmatimonadaceae bacterium]
MHQRSDPSPHVPSSDDRSRLVCATTLLAWALPATAQGTLLLRQPTGSERHIAFAYANNIWVVDRAGGQARRLTSFQGGSAQPRLSPDGRTVAFTGTYAGNADVYIVPVDGGEPKRLTWHPGNDGAAGWTPDGKRVVFTRSCPSWRTGTISTVCSTVEFTRFRGR